MYVQLITFRLVGMTPEEFAALCDQVAPQYENVPGLISKVFIADPDDDRSYGGVYLWHSRQDADLYTREGLAQTLVTSPAFADFYSRIFAVVPGPTAITGGPLAEIAKRIAA